MDNARRNEMVKTREVIREEYKIFKQCCPLRLDDEPPFFSILETKLNGLPLRAFFTQKMVEALADKSIIATYPARRLFWVQLPFIVEVIICIQYYHNQILDGKDGVTTPDRIKDNLLKGNILKDTLYEYVDQMVGNAYFQRGISSYMRQVFTMVDAGQYIEKNCTTYNHWNRGVEKSFDPTYQHLVDESIVEKCLQIILCHAPELEARKEFIRYYLRRIYLTNGALYILLTETLIKLLSVGERKHLVDFATFFGLMHQLVNDIGDLVPTKKSADTAGKSKLDAFSDLKNGNITLPIGLHLTVCPDGMMANYLEQNSTETTPELEEALFQELVKELSIFRAMGIGKSMLNEALGFIPTDFPGYDRFFDMCMIGNNNKYYKHFYKQKSWYKKYRRWRKEQQHPRIC